MNATDIVLRFLERINERNVDNLVSMMTEDHVFIDSLGHAIRGREKMRTAWQAYYSFCPDYWVSHEEIFQNGNLVAVFGSAGGTIANNKTLSAENKWHIPAAWLARVENDFVKEWRVYADNKPVYDITAKSKNS